MRPNAPRLSTPLRRTAAILCLAACGSAGAVADLGAIAAAADIDDISAPCRALPAALEPALARAEMTQQLAAYQQLSEEALAMRAEAIRLFHALKARSARGEALSGADLQRLHAGAAALLAQRRSLLQTAFAHECWLDAPAATDPALAAVQHAGILMSLAAALTLYDNYLLAISLYQDDSVLRLKLNRGDRGFALDRGELDRITRAFASPENRRRVRRGIDWFERNRSTASAEAIDGSAYLGALIAQSPSYQMVREASPLAELGAHFGIFRVATADTLATLRDESLNLYSLLFGNTVGLVETRRGKLDRRADVEARVAGTLRAGDILLEKTPFRLTDTFIPGHWGHAAIWVGDEAELRALGIWEHPLVQAHAAQIRAGRGVVEALRSGVEMNPLANFLNIDDLAVLRADTMTPEGRVAVVLQALRQVGKAYDFNFDAESTQRVFCSKLVYLAYGDMQWPTARIFGRVTVSPDNIAARATGDGPLSVALLYHEGEEVSRAPRALMEKLVPPAAPSLARSEATLR
ncbi:hypothetical protein dqs_0530 [Azoarcus olearius]|uniref:YiiX/YebB-like N1pC/P60 family cysteine hydrolase n=1 Tax=Azoarcus sp. (strain BH72) TaxID=418699 RepID=UPI00080637D3|nr:YiiX/YebB-like N1pC/P60 family cysteine hydrolase [Azoarcus olearius]ANQ83606.1 hypothetical protein dqs_0530 [Azoarcus olearius]